MEKRTFLKNLAILGLSGGTVFEKLEESIRQVSRLNPEELSKDEDFWASIRTGYRLKPDYINLENGYYCFMPQEILENYIHYVREMNYQASHYLRTVQWQNKQAMHDKLAELAGCSCKEIVITRNTTESLDTIIAGYPWQKGDEAVMAEQDYGAMLHMFDQVKRRYGIENKLVSIPNHPNSDAEIVELYANAITPKTRLLMVCHMINITGQVLPVSKICDMAHEKGVEVMVDGAHTFAHLDFTIPSLHCDYFGASLHKWLSAPLGAGLLYVKEDKIHKIWPLLADWQKDLNDIARLNHTGTHPCHTDLTIAIAIDYYQRLGPARKEARLRYLQRYWSDKLREIEGIVINTPKDLQRSCAIANVGINGLKPKELADTLLKKYRIWTVAIDSVGVHGCRITPNIFTTTKELDVFIKAIKELAA